MERDISSQALKVEKGDALHVKVDEGDHLRSPLRGLFLPAEEKLGKKKKGKEKTRRETSEEIRNVYTSQGPAAISIEKDIRKEIGEGRQLLGKKKTREK